MNPPKSILIVIIISQFFCTSLWFAGNGVIHDLIITFKLDNAALGYLTSAVQLGFIIGTLSFAILSISDRYSPSKVFLVCALLAALSNLLITWEQNSLETLLFFRFLTGLFLAGIYPVGMKIASDYYEKGLGKSLGFLVGALVIGTAFPHLLKEITEVFSWKLVLITTSFLAVLGGILMALLVPNGPYRRVNQEFNLSNFLSIFKSKTFRSASFGYFGHMWELYTFWAFVPIILKTYSQTHPSATINISFLSFIIIGVGGLSCAVSGYLAHSFGTKRIATYSLLFSCICCLLSPLMFSFNTAFGLVTFLLFWGIVVIADSPLFSTLISQNAPSPLKGTALTIVNCIGFSFTIMSIQLVSLIKTFTESNGVYMILAIGPIVGLAALVKNKEIAKADPGVCN